MKQYYLKSVSQRSNKKKQASYMTRGYYTIYRIHKLCHDEFFVFYNEMGASYKVDENTVLFYLKLNCFQFMFDSVLLSDFS